MFQQYELTLDKNEVTFQITYESFYEEKKHEHFLLPKNEFLLTVLKETERFFKIHRIGTKTNDYQSLEIKCKQLSSLIL